MNKFKGILLMTDLDGTLLRNDKSISEENIRAIEYFKSEGGLFTFVTGRIPPAVRETYDAVKSNAPCGCSNGACIYDFEKERLVWGAELDRSVIELVEYVDKNLPPMGIELCMHDKIYFCKKNESVEKHRRIEKFPDLVADYKEVQEPIAKILFADTVEENLLTLKDMLANQPLSKEFGMIRSDKEYFEIVPKGVSKGTLLKKIAEITGVDPKRTVAVGDNENDIAMLKAAGVSFAVANAAEKAKKAADYVTVSNEEHAIAKIIDDIDKGSISV